MPSNLEPILGDGIVCCIVRFASKLRNEAALHLQRRRAGFSTSDRHACVVLQQCMDESARRGTWARKRLQEGKLLKLGRTCVNQPVKRLGQTDLYF